MTLRHVRDVMNSNPVVVDRETTFKDIAAALAAHTASAASVIDSNGQVIGIVSDTDLVTYAAAKSNPSKQGRFGSRHREAEPTAEGLMTPDPATVSPSETVAHAALLADTADVRQLPVVDERGVLCGIVTRTDLLRQFLRRDVTIRAEILNQVLAGEFTLEPQTIDVSVEDGVVSLAGQLEDGQLAEDIIIAVDQVPGVVRTESRLRHPTDFTGRHRSIHPSLRVSSAVRPG
jgi:CBS domain-containing protein